MPSTSMFSTSYWTGGSARNTGGAGSTEVKKIEENSIDSKV